MVGKTNSSGPKSKSTLLSRMDCMESSWCAATAVSTRERAIKKWMTAPSRNAFKTGMPTAGSNSCTELLFPVNGRTHRNSNYTRTRRFWQSWWCCGIRLNLCNDFKIWFNSLGFNVARNVLLETIQHDGPCLLFGVGNGNCLSMEHLKDLLICCSQ